MMKALTGFLAGLSARLNGAADVVAPLGLRLILAWEFYESGITKWRGDNWFGQDWVSFPFPFDVIPAGLSWVMAMTFELAGAFALLLGLFTRFFAFSLIILTAVATAAVHWPAEWASLGELWSQGYDISDSDGGNFKLPLLFIVMLLPLVFRGAGWLSLDHLICRMTGCDAGPGKRGGLESAALALAVIGFVFVFVMPLTGLVLFILAAASFAGGRLTSTETRDQPRLD